MGEGTDARGSEPRQRAEDAHRRLLEEATQRGARWQSDPTPLQLERVIIGGGLAATLAWATRARANGTCLVVARAEEPWWARREHRLGQPANELVSEGFVLQPHDFADDIDGFAPASALADAIAVTAHEHGMPLMLGHGVDRPIEREGERFVVYVGGRRIEAEHVDVAVGPGPARRLRSRNAHETIVTGEDERELLADGRMVFGQDQWRQPVKLPRVLVLGGGPTAAWNVEVALRHGANVTWVAAASESKLDDELWKKAKRIEEHLETHPGIDAQRRRWLERTWARIVALRVADLPRNHEVFRASGVEWWVGSVKELRPCSNGVAAMVHDELHDETHLLRFEQVVVAFGQDDRAPEASASLVRAIQMTWIERDHVGPKPADPRSRPSGRVVGACAQEQSPRLRCLGVQLRGEAWRDRLWRGRRSNARVAFESRLARQIDAAPQHSKGIDGAVFQVSADVILANGRTLDAALGHERYELLGSTLGVHARQPEAATSSGEGG